MKLAYTDRFKRSYDEAPESVKKAFDRRAAFLNTDLSHPSLRTRKYDRTRGIWQARVNRDRRMYFTLDDDVFYLLEMIPHPK